MLGALDGDWSEFTPKERAAFAFARKLTYEPHRLTDADIDGLRTRYKDLQILEIIFSVCGNNVLNRWKEGIGVSQSQEGNMFQRGAENPAAERPASFKSFLTPTPEEFRSKTSQVAPLQKDAKTNEPSRATVGLRPALERRAEVEKALESCRTRAPRLPLVDEEQTRALLGADAPM